MKLKWGLVWVQRLKFFFYFLTKNEWLRNPNTLIFIHCRRIQIYNFSIFVNSKWAKDMNLRPHWIEEPSFSSYFTFVFIYACNHSVIAWIAKNFADDLLLWRFRSDLIFNKLLELPLWEYYYIIGFIVAKFGIVSF